MPYKDPVIRRAKQVEATHRWERNHPEKAREYHRTSIRNWRAKNLERARAMCRCSVAVCHAVRSGRLVRPDRCQQCQAIGDVEAHHHNGYAREHYLDVQWLCYRCHHATKKFPPRLMKT